MTNATHYFELAHTEEINGNKCADLLLYLSSFCDSFNSAFRDYPYGTVSKIRRLQNQLSYSDLQLLSLVHSYGPLSNAACRKLLSCSISGNIAEIRSILSGYV